MPDPELGVTLVDFTSETTAVYFVLTREQATKWAKGWVAQLESDVDAKPFFSDYVVFPKEQIKDERLIFPR